MIIPHFLNPGDTIGIAATARKVQPSEINAAMEAIKGQGYNVVLASNIYQEDHQFSGTDLERASGLNELISDPKIRAIWIARGGYGSVRVIEHVNWEALQNDPKWICGFSDVTALHSHLNNVIGMASLHSEMMLGYEDNSPAAHESLVHCLQGKHISYTFKGNASNRIGIVEAELVGGNLSVLYSLLGSESQLETDGKILFIEDLDEYLYHVDRMMMALKRSGMLTGLKALIIGGMSDMNDNAIPFGKSAKEIILDVISNQEYPVCFDFPAGHIKDNRALIFGAKAHLSIQQEKVNFTQTV